MSTYTTSNGERANITLPDGSHVILNVASQLDVPADYAMGNHAVHLVGEALITTLHHDATPLTVYAGPVTVRVLGTTFLVRHYATDSGTTVAVRDGKVAVHLGTSQPTVLTSARQMFVSQARSGHVQMADVSQFSFATGLLSLRGVPLPKAIPELNRWYDADIRLADSSLSAQNFTGDCAAGSLADLTEILQATYNVRVVRHGRVVTLFPK